MQSTFMHPKFHVQYAIWLAMDNEHRVISVIGDVILLDHVAQSENNRNCTLAIPHIFILFPPEIGIKSHTEQRDPIKYNVEKFLTGVDMYLTSM